MGVARIGVLAHRGKTLGRGLDELHAGLAEAGFRNPPWQEVDKSRKAPGRVGALLDEGIDRLIVWGGDGTVRRCVETVVRAGADVSLAILPAGTANQLARELIIPLDLPGALEVALNGMLRRIDVGMVNGEMFVVMAGTGFDALLIGDTNGAAKERRGRLHYLRVGTRHLTAAGSVLRVVVDGDQWFEGRAACVLVGNVGHTLGGIEIFPDARCDDGLLDVGVITAQGRMDWLRVGARAVASRIDASPMVRINRGARVKVRLERALPWELDGGSRSRGRKLDFSVMPARLSVCVPAPTP